MSKQIIFWFEELGPEHNDVVGKKCANLGKLTHMGLAVPPGFALSIDMYLEFLQTTGLGEQLGSYVQACGDLKGVSISVYEKLSTQLRDAIETQEMPPKLKELISSYYAQLCEKTGIDDLAVSVRSAGTQSRPGMFETYLNVSGIDDVLAKVRQVWASAYTPRAIAFRSNKGLPVIGDELGVAIPKMVNSRASGIAFTVNPVDGDAVNKNTLEIKDRHIGNKTKYVIFTDQGADWADMPEKLQSVSCLSDEEVIEIARIAKDTEARLNAPQDMEWAIDQDLPFPESLFWLQTRRAKVAAKKIETASEHIADLLAKKLKGF
ncbi:MAG: PEP/pyruvate-binding domain-containing protein [Deltaproteobacteria bacterium]